MPESGRKTERRGKPEWADPSLGSERETDAAHRRRTDRAGKETEDSEDAGTRG